MNNVYQSTKKNW